jgi:phytoene desaturase
VRTSGRRTRAIVIGAGAGGLAAATHLARRGLEVLVVEKNEGPGGRCAKLSREGHHFDIGPTLFVMPRLYEQEFAALGEAMGDLLDLQRVDPTYHLIFDDGQQLVLTSDMDRMRQQLEAMEPGSFAAFRRYLAEGEQHYDLAMTHLVRRNFRSLGEFLSPANLVTFLRLRCLTRHYGHMKAFFDEPRLRASFTFQDMYMGISPFEAPATFSLLQYTEIGHGVWFPRGGMTSVIDAMVGLAQGAGVEFLFHASVERILTRNTHVEGVVLADGRRLEADLVVANADLPYVYARLLPPNGSTRRLERRKYSCSTVSFLWALDRPFPGIPPHLLFLSDRYRANFEAIERDHSMAEEPSVYVHAPTRLDPSLAPPGQDTLIGIVPVGNIDRDSGQGWEELKQRARQALLSRLVSLGIGDLEPHIKFEISLSPPDWAKRLNLVKGATHGLAHDLLQMGYFRPHNRHRRYRNLYFAGASTHPGTGLPTALVSGRLAAERVLEDLGT